MTDFDVAAFVLWLGDAFLIIVIIAICCFGRRRQQGRRDDDDDDDRRRREASSSAAAAAPHAQREGAVQMATMATLALLDLVTYRRQNQNDGGGGGDDHPPSSKSAAAAAEEECAICLGQLEDGEWCSVMPVCCHEFHRSCIATWLTACNNSTCPLCRAQLQWEDAVLGLGMV